MSKLKLGKYAVLGIWKSRRHGEVVKAFPTFDTREEAEARALNLAMYEPNPQIAILERDPLLYDEYDNTIEVMYNFICALVEGRGVYAPFRFKDRVVVQPCWIFDNGDEMRKAHPWILDEDGEEKSDLKELFFPVDFLLATK